MSEFGDLDGIFEEMIRLAESLLSGQQEAILDVPRVEGATTERDELMERSESFEYILDAPGYEQGQLLVSVQDQGIEVKAPDFIARREFPSKVDPESASSTYRNGVLSVSVKKL